MDNKKSDKSNLFNNINNIDIKNIDHNQIQKMIFIYNAINDGWSVRKIDNEKFEFLKDSEMIKKEIILEEYIKKYMKHNILENN
jgi:hypothetical protein